MARSGNASRPASIALSGAFIWVALTHYAQAKRIQILHTNDLHSHFEHSSSRDRGNYAALKATIDQLRKKAVAQGMETLLLDAGDFTEGTQFYFAEEGAISWRAMDQIGYDAVALGNHDYLTGQADMDRIIRAERPRFQVLAANFSPENRFRDLRGKVAPSLEIQRSGVRVAIVGLTTEDLIYKWRAGPGAITSTRQALLRQVEQLRPRNDVVIALTHIGLEEDKKMMKSVGGVDLVIGGHSHSYLKNPWMIKNPEGFYVPIFQAGSHGENVGQLIIEIPEHPAADHPRMRVLSYEIHPVLFDGPKDMHLEQFVRSARLRMEAQLGKDWLQEVIGFSEIPLEAPTSKDTTWGNLFGDAMRAESGAELSIDAGNLFGDTQDPGPITREKLLSFYPRTFEYGPGVGWSIWLAECDGWIIDLLIGIFKSTGYHVSLGGGRAGQLKALQRYTVAIPESIGRAIREVAPGLDALFLNPRNTGIKVLDAAEREIQRRGGQVR